MKSLQCQKSHDIYWTRSHIKIDTGKSYSYSHSAIRYVHVLKKRITKAKCTYSVVDAVNKCSGQKNDRDVTCSD